MKYTDLDANQKMLFTDIMNGKSYKELVEFCIMWLKRTDSYDPTREGLKLFMSLNGIECSLNVPTKKALVFCVMAMLKIDADVVNEEAIKAREESQEGYVKICKQDGRDVVIHKDDVVNFLETCFINS